MKDFILKLFINKHLKKFSNKQLKQTYLDLLRKPNKNPIDSTYIKLVVLQLKKRGILHGGPKHKD